jgi:hypothetical protein
LLKTTVLDRYDIPFTKETFCSNKVVEFVEDMAGDIEEELDNTIYYSLHLSKNNGDVLWILANEAVE